MGIGSSAGGIEALSEFLTELSATPGMAFILVQHRDPDHFSLLGDLLAKTSRIPIVEAEDGMALEVNHLYVVPAVCTVLGVDGVLRLQRHDSAGQRRMPIDSMLNSLARDRGRNCIAVVLSGTGSDGALGIQEIKGAGGIIFAQEPASARFDGMPKKAIETGCVDFILPPQGIAGKIAEIGQHPYLGRDADQDADQSSSPEPSLKRIFQLLRIHAQVDFSGYKRSTIQRRIARRMALRQVEQLSQYADLLRDDRNEVAALVHDFLIRVTSFFRNPEAFTGLTEI
ncbi:MAG TPA: chemotaxis protein CheB, partial [Candidatus Binataceae bacterium]|nr:chemotaxis protein CheB [Candidatus Binataceae bacterium]